jgi:hypothetical protein
MSRHLTEQQLALAAGGDLNGWEAWRLNRHLGQCGVCRSALAEMIAVRGAIRDASDELPSGVDWSFLASEMRANIRVGLEAGECVAPVGVRPEPLSWRPAAAFSALTAVVLIGWYLSIPRLTPKPFASVNAGTAVVEATPSGVELKHGAQGFALLNPRANRITYSVDSQGARAQYVDVETGQVTIANVALD